MRTFTENPTDLYRLDAYTVQEARLVADVRLSPTVYSRSVASNWIGLDDSGHDRSEPIVRALAAAITAYAETHEAAQIGARVTFTVPLTLHGKHAEIELRAVLTIGADWRAIVVVMLPAEDPCQ